MVRVNDIHSTATFAWSSDSIPSLATGTAAGVIDDSFSSSSSLDFYNLYEKDPFASAEADAKFHDLDWSKDNVLLAGALENGTIQFWNTSSLLSEKKVHSVAKGEKHTGSIKTLQFNPIQHNVLASGGANGEIFIWDTKNLTNLAPFAPGAAMTPMDVVHSVSWNNSVSHIFASAGTAGYTSIWDLKVKKEVLQLAYTSPTGSRAILSTVAWHPTQSTKLITASEADGVPLILTWDLRNSNVPEKILTGHKKGVLSVDWNARDPSLLLSSGKDNTTILWNPLTSEMLAQYPTTSNWAFKTKFAPSAPDYFATASLDKKIVIQTLQDTSPPVSNRIKSTSETDFWNKISDTDTQQPEFFVKQAPNWYGRPSSVSFGFGSKIVKVAKTGDKSSQIYIEKANLPGSKENDDLKTALESKDFTKIIESRVKESFEDVNRSDWELLDNLKDESNVFDKFIALNIDGDESKPITAEASEKSDEFFDNLNQKPKSFAPTGEFKLATNELNDALLTRNLPKAVEVSLKNDKLVEALIIALNGPEELKQTVLNYYLNKHGSKDATARLLYSVSSNDIRDIVENADVSNWKEIGNAIKTYCSSDQDTYRKYFNELGDRILKADPVKNRNDAILSYISASSLEKVAEIWVGELRSLEAEILKSKRTSLYDAHFDSLTEFVEKLSAYRSVLKLDAPISDTESPLLSTILEYTNIISTNGQFDLALKFLSLLSDDIPSVKLEKERISIASGVNSGAVASRSSATASSRYGKLNSSKTPISTAQPVRGRPSVASNQYSVQPQQQSVQPPSANPYAPPPSANPYGAPQPQQPLSTPDANPYRPNGFQAGNPLKPASMGVPSPGLTSASLPPPPKNGKKHETDGWNDLPKTFHKPQPISRPVPTAAPAYGTSNNVNQPTFPTPSQPPSTFTPPPVSRNASFHNPPSIPPPPRSISRSRKSSSSLQETASQSAPPPKVNSRYTPVASQSSQPPQQGTSTSGAVFSPPPINPTTAPPKNPYAITPQLQQQPFNQSTAYSPQSGSSQPPSSQQPFTPLVSTGASTTPKNPYAIAPPQEQQQGQPNFGAPASRAPLTAAASLQQQYEAQAAQYSQGPPPPPQGPGSSSVASAPPQTKESPKPKNPSGDRSHISQENLPVYQTLESIFLKIQPNIPENFNKQFQDTGKRLNILFDHLNNEDLLTEGSLSVLRQLVDSLKNGDYATALAHHLDLATNHTHEGGHWLVGIKRLIQFAEAVN